MSVDVGRFRDGMRRLAAGVAIIAVHGPDGPQGLTATSVTSLSDRPPSLLCCVGKPLAAHAAITAAGAFSVNLLDEDQHDLAQRFAGTQGAQGGEKFEAGNWSVATTGAPILSTALASFDCRLGPSFDVPTHTIFTGLIDWIGIAGTGRPLIYANGDYSGLETARDIAGRNAA